jgi:anti-sigma factor RsiW
MDPTTPRPPSADDEHQAWHALVDGRLPPAQAQALQDQLAHDPAAQASIARWQHQRTQLRALHQDLEHATVPDALLQAALAAVDGRARQHAQWWRWGGMAASVLAAFGLGWAGHGQWVGQRAGAGKAGFVAVANPHAAPAQRFAQQAAMAHAVYQPEVRHPVEVAAAQQDHLVQWLSKRLNRPLRVPVLSPQGYELVGGRLLPGDSGARAQFMYQNGAGQRITLYLGALAADAARPSGRGAASAAPPSPAAAFQFAHDGPVPAFYWVDDGFGYALSGQLSRPELLALATSVYQQLPQSQ